MKCVHVTSQHGEEPPCSSVGTMVYRLGVGTVCAVGWSCIVVVAVGGLSATESSSSSSSSLVVLGPSNASFAGVSVNTWGRWWAVMTYATGSQVAYSIVSSTLSPYLSNVVRDHKTPRREKGNYLQTQLLLQAYTVYHWLSGIMDVYLWMTLQLQFIFPALAVDLALTAYFTHGYLVDRAPPLLEECVG